MGIGYIKLRLTGSVSHKNITVSIFDIHGNELRQTQIRKNGITKAIPVDTPSAVNTLRPDVSGPCFAMVDVKVSGNGEIASSVVRNVPVFDGVVSVLPVTSALHNTESPTETALPPVFGLHMPHEQPGCMGEQNDATRRSTSSGCMGEQNACPLSYQPPESIVVHLGRPASKAPDVRLPFLDYLKTAVSCEVYPTWPEAALEANIYCILSIALHRLQNDWYRLQGYPFDLCASPSFDPYFVPGWPVFENVGVLVDRVWNKRLIQNGCIGLFPTPYCNGATSVCPGFSQWGSVSLAHEGMSAIEILRYYFGSDIFLADAGIKKTASPSYGKAVMWWLLFRRQMLCLSDPL